MGYYMGYNIVEGRVGWSGGSCEDTHGVPSAAAASLPSSRLRPDHAASLGSTVATCGSPWLPQVNSIRGITLRWTRMVSPAASTCSITCSHRLLSSRSSA